MAKEAGKPKPTVKKKQKEAGKQKRSTVKFCPNSSSSKSFNLSTTRSKTSLSLRKNNEDLAKSLNYARELIAKLQRQEGEKEAQIMELKIEIGQLRASQDDKVNMAKINKDIRAAIDHAVGLSGILTSLCVSTNRVSVASAGSSVGLISDRSSDIGGGRMRQVATRPAAGTSSTGGNTWSRGSQGSGNSPPRQLSTGTVRPMVAGHAISRPRIQLERVDMSAMTQMTEPQDTEDPGVPVTEDVEDEMEEVAASPQPAPTRNVFDLTNINEESTMMEDSIMNAMEETVISPNMEAVQEENIADFDQEEEAEEARMLTSTVARKSLRQSLRPPPVHVNSLSPGPSQSPISPAPLPDTSPYVLETDTTPVGFSGIPIPRQDGFTRPTVSQSPNQSTSFSESILERMVMEDGCDPLEGPSWLFASAKKKKRKSSAVRKLSCIMSDLDNTAGTSSMDGSELEVLETSSGNHSGLVLDKDLRLSNVAVHDDQENVPLDGERTILNPGSRVSVAASPRTPLTSLRIKEARIMLSNVGATPQSSDSPTVGRNKDRTLDQLFALGLRNDSDEGSLKRKFGSEGSNVSQPTVAVKKARITDIAQQLNQNLEVRVENVGQQRKTNESGNSEQPVDNPVEGRSRRAKSQVSYKEVSVTQKMRQGDVGSSINYSSGFEIKEKRKRGPKKK